MPGVAERRTVAPGTSIRRNKKKAPLEQPTISCGGSLVPRKTRKRFTTHEKLAIPRFRRFEHVPVSDLCDQYGIHPPMFCRWQEELLENGPAALEPHFRRVSDSMDRRIALLDPRLQRKHEVLSDLVKEHIKLRKDLGEI